MKKVKFTANVRGQKGYELTGIITSKHLVEFIGKKVVVKVRESEESE